MKPLLVLACAFITFNSFSQAIYNSHFAAPTNKPCPNDTTVSVLSFNEWEAYQTTNDEWDGPRDTACFWIGNFGSAQIRLDDAVPGKPIFFRQVLDSANKILLQPNEFYSVEYQLNIGNLTFDLSATCPNGVCTGIMAGIEIPDSAGTGTDMRWHQQPLDNSFPNWLTGKLCFPTEKFTENYLRELIVRFAPINPAPGDEIAFSPVIFDNPAWVTLLDSASMTNYLYLQFQYLLYGGSNYIVKHDGPSYPNANNIGYLDVYPIPNWTAPYPIDITVDAFAALVFQPHTALRGGFVQGDTTRHPINLINNGMICTDGSVELVFEGDDRFTYQGGQVEFGGPRACFQFRKGGTLIVSDGATFAYGKAGNGMLAMRPGGQIEIGNDAELAIQGTMMLCEHTGDTERGRIDMDLNPGSKLSFAEDSRVISPCLGTKLYITMKGGELDLSGLSAADVKHIRLLYPEGTEPVGWSENLHVWPNPVQNRLLFDFESAHDTQATVRIYDLNGRQLKSEQIRLVQGENQGYLKVDELAAGAYMIVLHTNDRQFTSRFVKQ